MLNCEGFFLFVCFLAVARFSGVCQVYDKYFILLFQQLICSPYGGSFSVIHVFSFIFHITQSFVLMQCKKKMLKVQTVDKSPRVPMHCICTTSSRYNNKFYIQVSQCRYDYRPRASCPLPKYFSYLMEGPDYTQSL